MLESVTFTEERAEKLGTNIQETIFHELAANIPTLKTIIFGSEVREIRQDGVALPKAELTDA